MDDINAIIDRTVNHTVLKLKMAGLIKDERKTAFEKTEELLKNYTAYNISADETAQKMVNRINSALELIKEDPYYETVTLYYMDHWTRERIAEYFDTSETTISRNKTRLVDRMKNVLFSEDAIREVYTWLL